MNAKINTKRKRVKFASDNVTGACPEVLDAILKVENHLRTLTNYGNTLEELVETLRSQSKNGIVKDIYGCQVVDNSTSVEFKANTMEDLKSKFHKHFKIAV